MRDNTAVIKPFKNAEDAFFAMVDRQRHAGTRSAGGSIRPASGLDTQIIIERLYRERKITMDHILVLRHYGKQGMRPDALRKKEQRASILWQEAMLMVEIELTKKGILHENAKG